MQRWTSWGDDVVGDIRTDALLAAPPPTPEAAAVGMELIFLIDVDDLTEDEGVRVEARDLPEPVAVFSTADGIFVLADKCSHAAASLSEGFVEDCRVECPIHSGRFDLRTGKACSLPARHAVTAYPTTIRDGRVYVSAP